MSEVHQPASPSICPVVPSLQRGLPTNPGGQRGANVGAVEDMLYGGVTEGTQWGRVRRVRRANISSKLIMCGGSVHSILLFIFVARCLETIDICIWGIFVFMSVVVTVWAM